jgi:hypothetical protein
MGESGRAKNFARYAGRIGQEWAKSSDGFNEFYYRRVIARALIFKTTEKLVSQQPWYNGRKTGRWFKNNLTNHSPYGKTLKGSITSLMKAETEIMVVCRSFLASLKSRSPVTQASLPGPVCRYFSSNFIIAYLPVTTIVNLILSLFLLSPPLDCMRNT